MDAGIASNNRGFWQKIQGAFTRKQGLFDKIQFPEDVHLSTMSPSVNPGENVQSHGWKKLRSLWRDVNNLYKEVLFNYTKLVSHFSPPSCSSPSYSTKIN